MSISLSLVENQLNKYTFKYNIPKFYSQRGLLNVWLECTNSKNKIITFEGQGRPSYYEPNGSILATLPPHETYSIKLVVRTRSLSNLQYSNILTVTSYSGKIDPPLNVKIVSQDTPRSLEDWQILLTWDNSKNIGSAPISQLKIVYNYGETTPPTSSSPKRYKVSYSKVVDINEWDSDNSYSWAVPSPLTKGQNKCNFSLFFINENGEESVAADAPHNLGPARTNTIFTIAATWRPDVTISATPLFNSSSWTNNSDVDDFIKPYLTIGSERWSQYMGISPTIASKIQSIDSKFYNGIYLNQYTSINDSSKPILQCEPAKYVGIKLNDGRWNFITVSFNVVFNTYYQNNLDRASNWDLIYSATHHLGHALGIGVYWHLNQLYSTSNSSKSDTIDYPRYRLDGNLFPQTRLIHNVMYRVPQRRLAYDQNGNPTDKIIDQPNPLGVTCNDYWFYELPCANIVPNNPNIAPLTRRTYRANRRFVPLDQIGSLNTDIVAWNGWLSPSYDEEISIFLNGDRTQPAASGVESDTEIENFPGCHFGLIDNPLNRLLFTYNHRELNDIMLYRTVFNDNALATEGSYPQRITALSIAHLKDLGYTELYENQKPGPTNLRAEELADWSEGYSTSKLDNHSCCRGFSPTQIESWQSNAEEYSILSNGDSMSKIADIIDDIIYCYINPENEC
jgi:hypothetical protein